jgi:serine/threonine protein kinase
MPLKPGSKLLDRYEIKYVLGKGTFGTVYLAYDPSLDREVAIKELAPEWLSDSNTCTRFINDARTMGSLEHANVVFVYDLLEPGKNNVKNYYIIMKYLRYGSLEDLIEQRHTLPIRDSLDLIIGVCKGLAAAHKRGIIHRDIKPDNILLGPEGEVKLGDFGVAHIPGVSLTKGGEMGTLYWLSVEQAQNLRQSIENERNLEKRIIDERSDLYSLCAVLYRIVTGRLYLDFDACQARARKAIHLSDEERLRKYIYLEVCTAIENAFPQPPIFYRKDIPRQLNVEILKGLSKKPEDRFKTASEMAEALEVVARSITTDIEDDNLKKAAKLLEENRFNEAHQIVNQVLKRNVSNTDALELMGDIHSVCYEFTSAVNVWEKAIKLQPDRYNLYSKLGRLYSRLNRFDRAVQAFKGGLKYRSDDPFLCYGLATALWEGGQPQLAIEALRTSCKILPDPRKEALLARWEKEAGNASIDKTKGDEKPHG